MITLDSLTIVSGGSDLWKGDIENSFYSYYTCSKRKGEVCVDRRNMKRQGSILSKGAR
jgi:hypothetical protein